MDDFKKVKETYSQKFKGFGSYTECMTRGLFTGLSSFALSFSAMYFTQVLLKRHLPYEQKYFLLLPSIASTIIAWKVTSERAKLCQDAWVSSEAQYTSYDKKR
ncbi:transmembrane protein 141 [Parasteatoda tepidariorum]|uniref:transmembrane protein 141 n=1 Tax=Parasteatoda tepidariorum TaxID=114398 RepID=UPI00077F850E|nr:transmembrane protein 141 isoform X2 [Parasteatoda tepidariorum]